MEFLMTPWSVVNLMPSLVLASSTIPQDTEAIA